MYVPSFFPFGHGKRVGTPTLSNRLRILLVVLALLVGNGAGAVSYTHLGQAQMSVCFFGDTPPSGGAGEEAHLHQIRLVDILQSDGLLVDGGGQGLQAHGAASVVLNDAAEHPAVDRCV